MKCRVKIVSSLEKVLFDGFDELAEHRSGSMLRNEIYSFQIVTLGEDANYHNRKSECRIVFESGISDCIGIRSVGYVPCMLPGYVNVMDDDYITKTPGILPDPLHSVKDGIIEISNGQPRSFWVSVEPKGKAAGTYPIRCVISDCKGDELASATFTLTVIDAQLPDLPIYNTGWFHGDCVAKLHGVEIQSEDYWRIVADYLDVYVKFGHNTILTPVFTPPLDTAVGCERPTNQLVEVAFRDGEYRFGFEPLRRWIRLCSDHGIRYFEISHLFTQWGGEHAPKIMATVDGQYRRIFGWETDSLSDEYVKFLHAFLTALTGFLSGEGVKDRCLFHISDEPAAAHEERYGADKAIVSAHVPDDRIIDALSDYGFYEKGIVKKPVVSTNHIGEFLEHDVRCMWAYYCCGQGRDVANRFMAMPSYRNRVLGLQLYKYRIEGFLQWGFNFWFSERSAGVIDPYRDATAGGAFPAGDAFVVYPEDKDGDVVPSLRLCVFAEAMQDLRALTLLERLRGREHTLALLGDIHGFDVYPRNGEYLTALREKVNGEILSASGARMP